MPPTINERWDFHMRKITHGGSAPVLSRKQNLVVRAVLAALAATVILASPASATVEKLSIDPKVVLDGTGRNPKVTVKLSCATGQSISVRATVNQRALVADGRRKAECAGSNTKVAVTAVIDGRRGMRSGSATACVLVVTAKGDESLDSRQLCRDVRLALP